MGTAGSAARSGAKLTVCRNMSSWKRKVRRKWGSRSCILKSRPLVRYFVKKLCESAVCSASCTGSAVAAGTLANSASTVSTLRINDGQLSTLLSDTGL